MGLIDTLANAMMNKVLGEKGAMAQMAVDLFNQNGGLEGILEKFKAGGLADEAASWVGKGENISISADQVASVLGSGAVSDIAAKLGMDANDVSGKIAEYLPQIIDKMTPDGEVNEKSGDVLGALLSMLK